MGSPSCLPSPGTYIQDDKYWEVKFLTSIYQVGNSRNIYQRRKISMCCNSSCTGKKLMKYKVNTNLKFSLPSKLPISIINAESYFFFPLLKPFFRRSNLPCFSFKIKDRIILLELVGMVKNNLSLFELDSKTSLVCHNALTSTKWRNMKTILTLILLVAMSTSASILSTNSLPAMVARHVEEFQVCVLEQLWNFR